MAFNPSRFWPRKFRPSKFRLNFRSARTVTVVLTFALGSLVLGFQNCAPGFDVLKSELASRSSGGDSLPGNEPPITPDVPIDPLAPLSVYVRNTEIRQGTDLVFKIELNKPHTEPVSVQLLPVSGSAMALVDFEATTPTAVIPATQLSTTVTVPAIVFQATTADKRMTLRAIATSAGEIAQADGVAVIKATQKTITLTDIASDFVYNCGLSTDSKVICWGGLSGSPAPTEVAGLAGIKQIAVGGYDTCVITADDKVKCFRGSLGPAQRIPAEIAGVTGARQVATGFDHACALLSDFTVKCWGRNSSGQLGIGSTDAPATKSTVFAVTGLTNVKSIGLGGAHSCALLNDGQMKCWGAGGSGQLGVGTSDDISVPTTVPGLSGITKISVGGAATCAFTSDSKLKCWGFNATGQLGLGTTTDVFSPTEVTAVAGIKQIALANNHSCGLMADNKVKCWGYNVQDQLGNASSSDSLVPVEVAGLSAIKKITQSCAITVNDTVKCWGYNVFGQLGDSTSTSSLVTVDDAALLGDVKQIATANADHSCAVTMSGTVKCWSTGWGRDNQGHLGNGMNKNSFQPVQVLNLAGAKQVAVGYDHSCAITSTDSVKCWGYNGSGHLLGDGGTENSNVPVDVVDVVGATQLVSAGAHTCAIVAGGKVRCWGFSGDGQLGDGLRRDSLGSVEVSDVTGATQLALGMYHSCALVANGVVKCWGDNSSNQIGNNSDVDAYAPVSIGLSGVKKIAADGYTTCAITSTDTVQCWGRNPIPTVDVVNIPVPTTIAGFVGATAISMNYQGICTQVASGSVFCAGSNTRGQFGNGDASSTVVSTPVEALRFSGAAQISLSQNALYGVFANGRVRKVGQFRQQSHVPVDVTVPTL